ncbi:hypothetical protein ACJIZ3_022736 [Penstemon smallii]|uniref:RING-type E3 ubiquitin transferase n=1 Tax=Penstemon smallii TaxID=265156 RepID=A0ABD3TM86_9LAMI
MNNNSSTPNEGSDLSFRSQTFGGIGYGIALTIGLLVLFVIITYISYKCKLVHDGATAPNPLSTASRTSLSTTTSDNDLTIHENGLDEATLSSYPQFTYSQIKLHKSELNASICSICLADYKDTDSIRLLPDCGHVFHLKCIDPWLLLHSTCPICRNSPLVIPTH